ncbi:MAG: cytochrome c oxidase subunit II [Candidatus Eremiobacteraeota bacterium]|nr:cytochrome c oxidase subunit II [Candidatus Eremiobacteraeota bacterium]MBV8221745.1 cytochrome c oxidase subunit II [Candidatus Eremiobacteraeota bacterium]MBV8281250.1 cytochrome c oxidase subunit II [Candidatus Eremiobacteraeota bacterium]
MHVHRLERIWMTFGIVALVIFLGVLGTAAISEGIVPPSHIQTIDPTKVVTTPPFNNPGLRKIGENEYEAYILAQYPAFTPHEISIPAGAKVTFFTTSSDVVHGFFITNTDVNLMVVPGWVSTATHVFRSPGQYLLLCNEYCGREHHYMYGTIEVR